jgi:LemA protein
MISAQHTDQEVEGHIAASRRFYNANVTSLRNAMEVFPGSLIAAMAGLRKLPLFEVDDAAVRAPMDADEWPR